MQAKKSQNALGHSTSRPENEYSDMSGLDISIPDLNVSKQKEV